jgi:hypothetical protein
MARGTVKTTGSGRQTASSGTTHAVRNSDTGQFRSVTVEVMGKARASGLLDEKGSRISGRVSRALVEQAKRRTGITEDTQLIEFALASLALEDNFSAAFKAAKGTVDPDIKLGF